MSIKTAGANKALQWAASISLLLALFCGIGESIAWGRLKVVPCATNYVLEWKGMTKCVPEIQALLWHVLDYGWYAAVILLLVSALVFKVSEAVKS